MVNFNQQNDTERDEKKGKDIQTQTEKEWKKMKQRDIE